MNNLQLANDIGLLTTKGPELQDIRKQIGKTSSRFSLMINAENWNGGNWNDQRDINRYEHPKEKLSGKSNNLSSFEG